MEVALCVISGSVRHREDGLVDLVRADGTWTVHVDEESMTTRFAEGTWVVARCSMEQPSCPIFTAQEFLSMTVGAVAAVC